jgi:hypothetical protein
MAGLPTVPRNNLLWPVSRPCHAFQHEIPELPNAVVVTTPTTSKRGPSTEKVPRIARQDGRKISPHPTEFSISFNNNQRDGG